MTATRSERIELPHGLVALLVLRPAPHEKEQPPDTAELIYTADDPPWEVVTEEEASRRSAAWRFRPAPTDTTDQGSEP